MIGAQVEADFGTFTKPSIYRGKVIALDSEGRFEVLYSDNEIVVYTAKQFKADCTIVARKKRRKRSMNDRDPGGLKKKRPEGNRERAQHLPFGELWKQLCNVLIGRRGTNSH